MMDTVITSHKKMVMSKVGFNMSKFNKLSCTEFRPVGKNKTPSQSKIQLWTK